MKEDDFDFFLSEFAEHILDARAAHADRRANRVQPILSRANRQLGTYASIAGNRRNLNQAVLNLRHLTLEQPPHEISMGT